MAGRPILLDVTRTLRRAGAPPSGIDRVERAYLGRLVAGPRPLWGIMRRQVGHSILNPEAMRALMARVEGRTPWPDAERDKDRGLRALRGIGARWLPSNFLTPWAKLRVAGGTYVAVSHTGFDATSLDRLRRAGVRVVGLVHDTIPLDAPEHQTAASRRRFAAALGALSEHAATVIYNSEASRAAAERHMERMGRVPDAAVALLGVEALPDGPLPPQAPPAPYFLAVGTVEPRKNIGFLLEIWPDVPATLVIAGREGWMSDAVAARLRAGVDRTVWIEGPTDAELGGLMRGAAGLLMPSLAEGFGLPAAEAAATGLRVLCNDLPVYREFLGDNAVYAPVTDPYHWTTTIRKWAAEPGARTPVRMPTWAEHFETVEAHI